MVHRSVKDVEAMQFPSVLMESEPALLKEQGYVMFAQRGNAPVPKVERLKTGGSVRGSQAKDETELDL